MIATIIALIPAQVLRILIDSVILSQDMNKLLLVSLIYAGSYLLIGSSTFIKDVIMLSISQFIATNLKKKMMGHVEKLKYKKLVNPDSKTLESYFNNDVKLINELFTFGVVNIANDLFKMIAIIISIFIYSYLFLLIVLIVLPIIMMFTFFVRKRMLKAQFQTKTLESRVNKVLLENVEKN